MVRLRRLPGAFSSLLHQLSLRQIWCGSAPTVVALLSITWSSPLPPRGPSSLAPQAPLPRSRDRRRKDGFFSLDGSVNDRKERYKERAISFFARGQFDNKEQLLHKVGLAVYGSVFELSIYCIGAAANHTLRTLWASTRVYEKLAIPLSKQYHGQTFFYTKHLQFASAVNLINQSWKHLIYSTLWIKFGLNGKVYGVYVRACACVKVSTTTKCLSTSAAFLHTGFRERLVQGKHSKLVVHQVLHVRISGQCSPPACCCGLIVVHVTSHLKSQRWWCTSCK